MHFLCLKTPQITDFLHRVSPRLPESAAKVAVSVLWVSLRLKKHRTLLFHTSTQLYACVFGCLFGQNSIFLQFSGAKSALLSQPKAKLLPSVPRTSFLEPCSCFLQHFSQSFPGSAEHKCSKPRKTPKNAKLGFSHASAIFFAEKHFVGCRYIYNKTLLTCTNDSPSKKVHFQNFHRP